MCFFWFADVLFFRHALYFIRLICYLVCRVHTGIAGFWRMHTIFAYTCGDRFARRQCNGCRWTKRMHIIRSRATHSAWLVVFFLVFITNVHVALLLRINCIQTKAGNFSFVVFIITIFLIIGFCNFFPTILIEWISLGSIVVLFVRNTRAFLYTLCYRVFVCAGMAQHTLDS